jgi:hypothetical protein
MDRSGLTFVVNPDDCLLQADRGGLNMNISRTLKQGATGVDVEFLAEQLTSLGYITGPKSDTFGETLERAVTEFQGDYGLKADGTVGPATLRAIRGAVEAVTPGSLRVDQEIRQRVTTLHQQVISNIDELSALVAGSFELDNPKPVSRFTLTRTPAGPRINMKFDPGIEVQGSSLPDLVRTQTNDFIELGRNSLDEPELVSKGRVADLASQGGLRAICYQDPPGICFPCTISIVIIIRGAI